MGALALGQDDVHIWCVFSDGVRDPAVLERYAGMMSSEERARRDRFVFEKDRHQFVVTRGMIRTLVARYLDVDPAACVFATNEYGRPSIAYPPGAGLAFNISHTGGLVVCALTREPEIGVDVEDTTRPIEPGLARRFFSPAEADALDALPVGARALRFYEYWTLKEAYIKARGMGLSLPLDGFSVQVGADGPPTIRFAPEIDDAADSWQFAQFRPTPRHHLAVAVRRRGRDRAFQLRELPSA